MGLPVYSKRLKPFPRCPFEARLLKRSENKLLILSLKLLRYRIYCDGAFKPLLDPPNRSVSSSWLIPVTGDSEKSVFDERIKSRIGHYCWKKLL